MTRVAILAHGKFPERAKTAVGLLRYGDREVVGVVDRDRPARRVADLLSDVQDAPIYPDVPAVLAEQSVDELVIGVAPIGGGFDPDWRPDVRAALEAGCDVTAGLHYLLSEDEEFARLADRHGCRLRDVRRPPDDLTVAEGTAGDVAPEVVVTVGTDCSVGKMTTTMELARGLRRAGHEAAVVPTGQTAIMIEGWGIAVDRAVSDFAAGAVERMVHRAAGGRGEGRENGDRSEESGSGDDSPDRRDDPGAGELPDYLVVEGQGSIVHPAYSGVTCSILHGAAPDSLVLCHAAGRSSVHGYDTALPAPEEYVDLYERLARPVAPAEVVAGSLNTTNLDDAGADANPREAVEAFAAATGVPATDPVRFDPDPIVEAVT